jgi:hypothetical protein
MLLVSCTNKAENRSASSDPGGTNNEVIKRQSEIRIFEAKLIDATERIQTIKRRSVFITGKDTISYTNAMDSLEIKRDEVIQMVDELKESSSEEWREDIKDSEETLNDLILAIEYVEEAYVY